MRVLQVVDSAGWAIGKLAKVIEKKNAHLDIKTIVIHPKDLRNYPEAWVPSFEHEVETFKPDIVHFHYWDVANTLRPYVKNAKVMLTHHNQKNLLSFDWKNFDAIVVHTKKAKQILEEKGHQNVHIIQHGIDIEKFKYLEEYDGANRLIGYVGRIVPWKGLYEILKAAKALSTKVICMGRVDKADYYAKIQEFKEQMDDRMKTPDERQNAVFHEMGVYVGNSDDNIEEGPLGLLEAMASGIPVITTKAGEAADIIEDRKEGIFIEFNNYENLEAALRIFFNMTQEEKDAMRSNAWEKVRKMSEEKMAFLYEKLYYKVAFEKDLVSVIIPTYNRAEHIAKVLEAYRDQTYQPLEVIVCDDNSTDGTKEAVFEFALGRGRREMTIKYLNTGNEGYGLAQARNMGIFEASGYYLVFNDDRMVPDKDAVHQLIKRLSSIKEKAVVWGNKGAGRRDFIENFFAVRKRHLVLAGMFNERIDMYGGQSQEIRNRLRNQGFVMEYEPNALATPMMGTRRNKRRYDIARIKWKLYKLEN